MASLKPTLVVRVPAAQGVKDRFDRQALVWMESDCGRVTAAMMRAVGHRPRLGVFGRYKSEAAAAAALKRNGFDDIADVLTQAYGLEEIPPAAAVVGDIIGFPNTEPCGLTALAIALGNGRVFGIHIPSGAVWRVLQPALATDDGLRARAWRL